jgi:hypothetical protein
MFKRRTSDGSPDASWLAWPTMAEKRQSWPTVGSNFRVDDVKSAIAKWGRLVMVRYEVETEGDYKGRAVRCWAGKYQVGTVEAALEDEYRQFVEAMAAEGLPATSRARFDRSPTYPRLLMVGEPEHRSSGAPFLPPLTEVAVDVDESEALRLDSLFESQAKSQTAKRVSNLENVGGKTWLSIDGTRTGTLPGAQREYVDQVMSAGLPATCWAAIKRRPGRPLAVSVDVPDEREFGADVAAVRLIAQ